MKKVHKRVAMAVAAVIVIGVAAVSLGAANNQEDTVQEVSDTRLRVDVATPVVGDIIVTGEYIGTVDPDQMLTVYPKATGEVLSVNVGVGDHVEAGDVLCVIDSKTLQNNIAQTQASLSLASEQAQLNLSMAEKSLENSEYNVEHGYDANILNAEAAVLTAENAVQTAELGVANAEFNLRAARRNLQDQLNNETQYVEGAASLSSTVDKLRDAVTQAQIGVDNANLTLEKALLGLKQAENALAALQVVTEETQETISDQVKQAELSANLTDKYLALQQLQDQLQDYTVRASIGGIIEQKNISAYDMAAPSMPLFVISNKDVMAVTFNVTEGTLENIAVGDAVTVDKNGATYTGTISEISTMVDAYSGLFAVKASVDTPAATMRSGSTLKVFIDVKKAESDLLVPIDALYYDSGEPYVFVVEDGKAKKVYVETGSSDDENIQVTGGLSGGEQVITTWSSGLSDGSEVVLAEAAE